MKWKIHKIIREKKVSRHQQIIHSLLNSRGLTTPKLINQFLHPSHPENLSLIKVGIKKSSLSKIISRVRKAIRDQESIVIYGDYDADGICATAILWETLHYLGAKVIPFIPLRQTHGYGLSIKGLKDILSHPYKFKLDTKPSLVITVDNGIVAHKAVDFAHKNGIDVIVTDHHVPSKKLPAALAIFHTTALSGSGVSWLLSKFLLPSKSRIPRTTLDLAAIGSVADMVPLLGANRVIVKQGLVELKHTQRIGLQELFTEAGIDLAKIGTYEINFIISPRLNAMGRLEHALDSLRLLCTKDKTRARTLANSLGITNRQRQELTENQLIHAKTLLTSSLQEKIIIVGHADYHEGVIGLIAGKLVETYYRPAIVLSLGEKTSKASARSIPGFNMIEALRELSDLLLDVGGHPMAAGFTIKTTKINQLTKRLQQLTKEKISDQALQKNLTVDCQINLTDINFELYHKLCEFEPFGIGNHRPIFAAKKVTIVEARGVGQDHKHLKLILRQNQQTLNGIGFSLGKLATSINTGDLVDLAFTLEENNWHGKTEIQLVLKDLKLL